MARSHLKNQKRLSHENGIQPLETSEIVRDPYFNVAKEAEPVDWDYIWSFTNFGDRWRAYFQELARVEAERELNEELVHKTKIDLAGMALNPSGDQLTLGFNHNLYAYSGLNFGWAGINTFILNSEGKTSYVYKNSGVNMPVVPLQMMVDNNLFNPKFRDQMVKNIIDVEYINDDDLALLRNNEVDCGGEAAYNQNPDAYYACKVNNKGAHILRTDMYYGYYGIEVIDNNFACAKGYYKHGELQRGQNETIFASFGAYDKRTSPTSTPLSAMAVYDFSETNINAIKKPDFVLENDPYTWLRTLSFGERPNVKVKQTQLQWSLAKESGKKQFEIKDHLGNVHVTVSDRKLAVDSDNDGTIDYYTAEVLSAQDFYTGGSIIPGRSFNSNSYRYGYQGSEKTDEISGSGNHFTTFYREGDPRTMRWWSTDPVQQPWQSSYSYMDGNPIANNDILGDKVRVGGNKEDRDAFREELESTTGLDLVFNHQGKGRKLLTNKTTNNPNRLETSSGSFEARDQLVAAIDDKRIFHVRIGEGDSRADPNTNRITLGREQVSDFMNQAASIGLNPNTVGFALTFFHELHHLAQGSRDPTRNREFIESFGNEASLQTGPTVDAENRIRQQLGNDFGQRKSYFIRMGNTKQVPFTKRINSQDVEVGRIVLDLGGLNPRKRESAFQGQKDFGK